MLNVRVDNEMKDCLNNILNDNCMLTLAHINQELRQHLPQKPRIHDRAVARTLDGMIFHFKISRHQPAEWNRPDVIRKHNDYANWFMGQGIISECGYNIYGQLEARAERYVEKEHTGKSVGKEEEISPSHSPFLQLLALFSTLQ